jgi:hypothetical protein
MSLQSKLDSEELRFWEYLISKYSKEPQESDLIILLSAIHDAFLVRDGSMEVHPELVRLLTKIQLMQNDKLLFDEIDSIFVAFFSTLSLNLKEGKLNRSKGGDIYSGALLIPTWFKGYY